MAAKIYYQIVGRYMNGPEVTGYHLMDMTSGKNKRYTREQVAFLVGKGQVTNCSGRLYQDKLLLEGVGMSLNELPVQQEDGELSRTGNIGKVRKGTTAADAMTQVMILKVIARGNTVLGYVLRNSAGATAVVDREKAAALAKEGRIGNASYQFYNGKHIIRGIGINLKSEEMRVTPEELGIEM